MATIRKPAKGTRTRRRVEDTEPAGRVPKSAAHRGTATVLNMREIEISVQLSELVPVAQYANVTLGPVQIRWVTDNPGIEILGVVDWDETTLTQEQQDVYDIVRGYLRATSKLIEHSIAEDRELVEESVRLHNEREAEEAQKTAKRSGSGGRRRSR